MIEDAIVIIQHNLSVDVADTIAIFGKKLESIKNSIKSKYAAKNINNIILGNLSTLFN